MKILLVCAAGMSTSLLVEAMRKKAAEEGRNDVEIAASGSESLEDLIQLYDVVLVGPQVRHRFDRFREIASESGKPIAVIEPMIYGRVDGAGALRQAEETWKKNS